MTFDHEADREALLELLLAEEDLAPAYDRIPKRPAEDEPALSYAEERLWFLQELEADTETLSIRAAVRVSGPIDLAALLRSLDDIIERHSTLRTTISSLDGRPVPKVHDHAPMPVVVDDLRSDPDRQDRLRMILGDEAHRTFDLAKDFPVLVRLVRLAGDDHVLSVVIHHVASDGWSFKVFFDDLSTCYAARVAGTAPALADLPIDYLDYAAWQRSWITGDKLDTQLDYWRKHLRGPLPLCELPSDFVRPSRQSFDGGQVEWTLPTSSVELVRSMASRLGVTPFIVMLAVFELLLARRTGGDDIIVGTPVAGRVRPEVEGMIGMFLNTLVLRTDLSGDPTFLELVERVRDVSLGALDHQDVPFERLLIDLQPPRDLGRTPLFQVFFNMMSFGAPAELGALPGTAVEVMAQPDIGSKFDLTMYVNDHDGRLDLLLVYNRALYRPATMRQLMEQYVQLLRAAGEDPGRPISDYSLVTAEAIEALPDASAPLDAAWHGSIPAAIRRHALDRPDQVAVSDDSSRWTYRALAEHMDQWAAWLCARGVGEGHVVAIYAHRHASLVCAVASVLATGAAYLLLDPSYPPGRLARYLRTSRPKAWIALGAAPAPSVELTEVLDELQVEVRVTFDTPADLSQDGRRPPTPTPEHLREVAARIGPDSFACLTFTSGSTGDPKAVMGRHGSLTHFLPWQTERFSLTDRDRFSMLSGLAHDPIQRDMFWPLWIGATVVVPDPDQLAEPGWLAQWLHAQRITVTHLTPAMGQLITEPAGVGGAQGRTLDDLRLALFIGDALTRSAVARFGALAPRATVVNLYGTTETQRASGHHVVGHLDLGEMEGLRRREVLPLGTGIPGTQLLVRSAAGAPAGFGEIGDVWVRSHHLALGYLERPEQTASRFTEAADDAAGVRSYRTGDRGRYSATGEVEFWGRADDQVQVRGYRIEPGEIRAVLVGLPTVRDAAVVGVPHGDTNKLVAYVVPEGGADLVSDLRRRLREQLPAHMVPQDIVVVDRIPLTPNGKLDRSALPSPDAPPAFGPDGHARDALEAKLVELWELVLDRPNVGIHDNFFDLGGYSLLATRLFAQIEHATGQRVPVSALFQAPTIAELAGVLRSDSVHDTPDSLVAIQPLGSSRPFFYVAPYMISVLQFAHLGAELGDDQPLFGLQPRGLDGTRPTHTRIEDMAEAYLREIKTVQPHGPYRIGGHCSGAWVAFEMARQLEAAGEEVDTVILVDQGPPGAATRQTTGVRHLLSRLRFYMREGRLRHTIMWETRVALERMRVRRMDPSSEHVAEVRQLHRAAHRVYDAGPIVSDLVLVESEESLSKADKSWYRAWTDKTKGRLHETVVPGTHANLLERPYVEELADRLRWAFSLQGSAAAPDGPNVCDEEAYLN